MACDEVHGIDHVIRLRIVHYPVQADTAPTRLHATVALLDRQTIALGGLIVDIEQAMAVRARAGAARA